MALLTPKEYAIQKRICLASVYRLLKAGLIPNAQRYGHVWRIEV